MPKLVDAMPGDRFYFESNTYNIFTLLGYKTNRSSKIVSCKCFQEGKVHPVYFNAYKDIIIIKK